MMTEEQAKEVRRSSVWEYIVDELEYRITGEVEALKTCEIEEFICIQERIQALEGLKRLPGDVVAREAIPSGSDLPLNSS